MAAKTCTDTISSPWFLIRAVPSLSTSLHLPPPLTASTSPPSQPPPLHPHSLHLSTLTASTSPPSQPPPLHPHSLHIPTLIISTSHKLQLS
ncbi:hypothetical protein Pmani_029091 [Petrolisthes manimaculis]|uniref:Uncharacterized protein n=1 Tax=Petrolisthes manimaculis TaxID=1843537 RepID=A0AAE1P031_9EUCA|nr:hypothetical protein Pmani_029091 [Petrolisthes manimaculis]